MEIKSYLRVYMSKSAPEVRSAYFLVIAMSLIEAFMRWWNGLANRNGKLKFRTQQEAAEFVRRVQNENGGPNSKILAMRQKYDEVNRARESQTSARHH